MKRQIVTRGRRSGRSLEKARAECEAALSGAMVVRAPRRPPRHIEADHQKTYFDRVDLAIPRDDRYRLIFACPNQKGTRDGREMERLAGQGVRPGIPDILVDVVIGEGDAMAPGLRIELKRPIVRGESKPKVSPEQGAMLTLMQDQGYIVCVCYGWEQAWESTTAYLAGHYVPHQWAPSICL